MSTTLFDNYQPIDRYDRLELSKTFQAFAQLTRGRFNPVALNWNWSGSNIVVRDVFWQGYVANLWIEHDWTVHTNLVINLGSGTRWELRFNNIYGDVSGAPILGHPRVESDMLDQAVAAILTETGYWQLALATEPFALTIAGDRLSLTTYRFYPHEFYLDALEYLTELADRVDYLNKRSVPVKTAVTPIDLPWLT